MNRQKLSCLYVACFVTAAFNTSWSTAHAQEPAALVLEEKIPLGDVRGRIDHLAIDLDHRRLFVAELGNDSVGVVNLDAHKVIRTLTGFYEPQGVAYEPASDVLYVGNGGDGSVTQLDGKDFSTSGSVKLGDDVDNIRMDVSSHRVIVGYGDALGLIDARNPTKVDKISLKGHPEGFQIDSANHRLFVNVPAAHQIAVVDTLTHQQLQTWSTSLFSANYPMALDTTSQRLFVTFRHPETLHIFNTNNGHVVSSAPACGDADDVFFDAPRLLVYVSCGEGYLDVFSFKTDVLNRIGHIRTTSGARTSLFVPQMDKLFLAVRATSAGPATIWVFSHTDASSRR